MQKREFLGYPLVLIGIFLIMFTPKLTGAVIGAGTSTGIGFILGLAFVIGGCVVLIAREPKEGNLAKELLQSGSSDLKSASLKRVATEMGYELKPSKEGTRVLGDDGRIIAEIPGHRRVSPYVWGNALRSMANGYSNFRARTGGAYRSGSQ